MAWTSPRTYIALETVSAAMLNQQVRDNLLFLHDSRVSALPTSGLVDQDEVVFIADATQRILWRLKYNSAGTAAKKWEAVSDRPLIAHVAGSESHQQAAYTSCTTAVQLTVPLGGEYFFDYGGMLVSFYGTDYLAPSYGATAAADSDAAITGGYAGLHGRSPIRTLAASDVVALKHKTSSAVNPWSTINRYIRAYPVRVN